MDPIVTAAAIGVGGSVIVGVAGFWASVRNTSKTTASTLRAIELAEQGQLADRYSKAIEQLGSGNLDVRLGAVYALERIGRDSAPDHPTVVAVLAAFIREHSREQWPPPRSDAPGAKAYPLTTRPDVQAAMTVIGRRDTRRDRELINLTGAHLPHADLKNANLREVGFGHANLVRATLLHANLARAELNDADLTGAVLITANLKGAHLRGASLRATLLNGTILTGADLTGADLTGADLSRAFVTGSGTSGLVGSADLTDADLTNAAWSENMPVPKGWERNSSSGRLSRTHVAE